MDPKVHQAAQSHAQQHVRNLVERELTETMKNVGRLLPVEEKFLLALYNPDRRLG